MRFVTKGENETLSFAAELARGFSGGEVILLSGELGSGKTVFAKGIAAGLKIKDNITSPTFAIMNLYSNSGGGLNLCHADAYRLSGLEDALDIAEFFGQKNYVTVIEWPDKLSGMLDYYKTIKITINYVDESTREIIVE